MSWVRPGNGWAQVMSELAYERSGPERFLSAFRVLAEFGKSLQNVATESQARLYGQLVAHLVVLRRMSISIASLLEERADAGYGSRAHQRSREQL